MNAVWVFRDPIGSGTERLAALAANAPRAVENGARSVHSRYSLARRLTAGRWTLDPEVKVRILPGQHPKSGQRPAASSPHASCQKSDFSLGFTAPQPN